jgi:curli biogenesis system outer membrane secretion channel CsgG
MRLISWILAIFAMAFAGSVAAQTTRPIVAIYEVRDLSGNNLSETFSAMIETAITGTNKFRVMERSGTDRLLREQGGANTGLLTSRQPGRVGGFEGADYLIYGSITSVSVKQKSNFGASLLAPQGTNCVNSVVTMEVDVKITDARTSEVRYVSRLSEEQKGETTCGQAGGVNTASLLRSAADKVATGLVTAIYPIQIASVQPDGSFVLNYGQGTVSAGMVMTVFQTGAVIKDPATGEVIGKDESRLGFIQITDVQPRLSKAVAISEFAAAPPVGAIVRPATEAEKAMAKKGKKR